MGRVEGSAEQPDPPFRREAQGVGRNRRQAD
jgi:hypothetical protein